MGLKELFQLPAFLRPSVSTSQVTVWLLRVCITGLQVVGSFPYTWSGPPNRPLFSPVLCAWSVVAKVLLVYVVVANLGVDYIFPDDSGSIKVGDIVANIYMTFNFVPLHLLHLAMLIRSPGLAACLDHVVNDPQIMNTESLSCKNLLQTLLVMSVLNIVWAGSYFVYVLPVHPMWIFTSLFTSTLAEVIGLLSSCLLFKALSLILSTRLVDVAREGMVSQSLPGRALVSGTGFQDVSPLFPLEHGVRQIEKLHRDVTSCFFEAVTAGLLLCAVCVTGTIYTLLNFRPSEGYTTYVLLAAVYVFFILCSIGNDFQNKVATVAEIFKDCACETSSVEMKEEMNRLLQLLKPLRCFSMCGWYTLDKTLIMSMISVMMTYLVVLLQVEAKMPSVV